MIPWRVKELLREAVEFPRRRRASKRRADLHKTQGPAPVLGFGGLLEDAGLIHGGAVKLLALRDGFSRDETRFNILYLVSSAQPEFAEDLVRLCRSRGIKFVWNQNGVGYPAWAGVESEKYNGPMRRLRAQADFVVYQSEFCRKSAEKFLGPCAVPTETLLNPVDLEKFSPGAESLPAHPLRLLAMGTQNYAQRVLSVLECAGAMRKEGVDCRLTVAGPLVWKNAEQEVREAVASMNLSGAVEFHPPFRQDEAPGIYRSHHILIHPKYMDPCPTVVAEALACGLPVVASRSGGVPEMVDETCAKLVEVPVTWDRLHTPRGRQLADAVLSITADLEGFARAARARAQKKFDERMWLESHGTIFRGLLAGD